MDKIYLFTTSRCPACPAAKQFVADNGLKVDMITVDSDPLGMKIAQDFGVQFVPAFVVLNEEDEPSDFKSYTLAEFKEIKK